MLRENLLVVHQETTLAIERHRIGMSLVGESGHDRLEEIVIVVGALISRRHLVKVWSEVLNPSVVRPNGGLVTANGSNVKLARIRGDILSNFRTQVIFGQGHEVDLDVGVVLLDRKSTRLNSSHVE